MNTSKAQPLTPSTADWYAHLSIPTPPSQRGVHRIALASPTHARYALIGAGGRIIWDGVVEEPPTEDDLAALEVILDRRDPPRLTLIR